jgi:hypothetical protein
MRKKTHLIHSSNAPGFQWPFRGIFFSARVAASLFLIQLWAKVNFNYVCFGCITAHRLSAQMVTNNICRTEKGSL